MTKYYSDEKNVQIIVALLKAHGIKKVIASPGSANSPIVASFQFDKFFEVYSVVDERSAAYTACGLAAETGEPVVISCTGATASRNYLPGLTEAYYRKLPVLAITSTRSVAKIGNLEDQVIDRSVVQKDIAKLSVTLPIIKDDEDFWECEIKVNRAILELGRHGGGPVHINLPTNYIGTYNEKTLPKVRVVKRVLVSDNFPDIPEGKIAIFVGSHKAFTQELTLAIDLFCATYDAVVLCDHTSSYRGKYRVLFPIVLSQQNLNESLKPYTIIHIGEISSVYGMLNHNIQNTWRVSEDGELRDTFRKMSFVFEMSEESFFNHYSQTAISPKISYLELWNSKISNLNMKFPEIPFSNLWIASKMAHRIPNHSTIHFGILNSLRSWNFFELPHTVVSNSNVGGFGIDGSLSSVFGASLAQKDKLYYCILGDLAFFYDMNALGNRHLSNNLRILLVNNGKGTEFKLHLHKQGTEQFGDNTDEFIAAGGHFGNKSQEFVKHYAQDLGFEYLTASNKQDFERKYDRFLTSNIAEKPMIFEVFTNSKDERDALESIYNLDTESSDVIKQKVKNIIGENFVHSIKNVFKK